MEVLVVKATGEKEPFSEDKLRSSIGRAGIPKNLHDEVVAHVKAALRPDIPTSEIYKHILEFLGKSSFPHGRARYSLKQALMELGPSGYPFEKFIGAIFARLGYKTETDCLIWGKCVRHEVDVVISKDREKYMAECKFHQQPGTRSDIKIALYIEARFLDLAKAGFTQAWLVTNTKCTIDAITYARCVGMRVIAWGYPDEGNLQQIIERGRFHPVTSLTTLSGMAKKTLLDHDVVLCRDIAEKPEILTVLRLTPAMHTKVLTEARGVVGM